jgi:DNA-directed RNA polymerase specialized sigma24 family protein
MSAPPALGLGQTPEWARDVTDTDDFVQETLLQTFKRIGQFESRGVGALHAYLRQAALNRIREELRRKGRRPERTSLSGLEEGSHQRGSIHRRGKRS